MTGNTKKETTHSKSIGFWSLEFGISAEQRGFTLVEMVVTVAIFALISTIVIVRNAKFDNETLLQGLAYDIALSVRGAQQYGINVRGTAGEFGEPYGIHFDAGSNIYVMFRDVDDDGAYDEPVELLETFTIGRGAHIGDICLSPSEPETCQKWADIIFRRPNPDAVITGSGGSLERAYIELISARGDGERQIVVEPTGQISVQKLSEEVKEEDIEGGGDIIELP